MKITLKNVSYSATLSEETAAFTATVCIDGKPAFTVSNHGTGGCDDHHPLPGQTGDDMHKQIDALAEYAQTLPPRVCAFNGPDGKPATITYDLDLCIGDALDAWQIEKATKKILADLKHRVMWVGDDKTIHQSKKAPVPYLVATWTQQIRLKYPDAIVLNSLTREAAEELIGQVIRAQSAA